ncbi:hypothetical protein VOI32_07265 [Paraburkholderia caribensis]|jgi:hypothetical protein|uniref:Uncharacterized protein n=1 Tax=Paraburkholderia caribensis TaxID=75105 RepID=A0ABV0DRH6_9BURK|nr:hypothetical protein [Paraburkholderia caribensis]MCO4876231.1 hypothetical protein [Paraburkholderia caribensis]
MKPSESIKATRTDKARKTAPGFWTWLGASGNQRTLRFIGAGIAALISILVTVGLVGKRSEPPVIPAPASAAEHAVPAPARLNQTAVAASGGIAANVQGTGNQLTVNKGE